MNKKAVALLMSMLVAAGSFGPAISGSLVSGAETESDVPQTDALQADPPQADMLQTDAPQTDAPQTDAPQTEAPPMEVPQTETPPVETPQTETPPVETPQTETPPIETPQTETPPIETPQTETPTDEPGQSETELSERPETNATEQTESITDTEATESEASSERETEGITVTGEPEEDDSISHADTDDITDLDGENDDGTEEGASGAGSTYYWDSSWYVDDDFRFTQVEKEYAVTNEETKLYATASTKAQSVGTLPYFGLTYVLEEVNENWDYVESGDARGFVQKKTLTNEAYSTSLVAAMGEKNFAQGTALVAPSDNAAYAYAKKTVKPVLAQKVNGCTITSSSILEEKDPSARTVGTVQSGDVVYLLVDCFDGWYFVESGDVRGFIEKDNVISGENADAIINAAGTGSSRTAKELISPEENRACYYTLLSTEKARQTVSSAGEAIAATALSYVGKLGYVWGGTSLTTGCDCSGFTSSIYRLYGIEIPRIAQDQGVSGLAVGSMEEAMPGDIVYYSSSPHVGIYIGNGLVCHCTGSSSNTIDNPGRGVTVSGIDMMPVTSIRRFLMSRSQGAAADGGHRADPTLYTQEQMELIWAVVAQEDNGSYDGALAVITTAMNRTESSKWAYCGSNALSQLMAPGQFCFSVDSYWKARLGGNVPDYVKQAVYDCLTRGVRNHTHTSFRSTKGKVTGPDAVQIGGGNWYFG